MSGHVPLVAEVADLLESACRRGDPPAAACCAWRAGQPLHDSAHGASPDGRPTRPDSLFDLASVTKALATTSAMALALERGRLQLDEPVAARVPAFGEGGKQDVTVRELLGHRSGLAPWRPLFSEVMDDPVAGRCFSPLGRPSGQAWARARRVVLERVFAEPLGRRGARAYSDLGFIALGALLEAVSGRRLDALCREALYEPLGLQADLSFIRLDEEPGWAAGRHVLPTGRTRPREPAPGQEGLYRVPEQPRRPDAGRVDDDNAFAMGGVAGHAGLFGTARAVARFGAALLEAREGTGPLPITGALREMMRLDPAEGSPRALGFDVPTGPRSSAGAHLGGGPQGAFGHLGFTGCSLWLDLDLRLSVALLTNRTYPGRDRVGGIRALRPLVHDALATAR